MTRAFYSALVISARTTIVSPKARSKLDWFHTASGRANPYSNARLWL